MRILKHTVPCMCTYTVNSIMDFVKLSGNVLILCMFGDTPVSNM